MQALQINTIKTLEGDDKISHLRKILRTEPENLAAHYELAEHYLEISKLPSEVVVLFGMG